MPGCTREAIAYRDDYAAIVAQGAEVVGISGDEPANHQLFKEKYQLKQTLLADDKGDVGKAFGLAWSGGGEWAITGRHGQGDLPAARHHRIALDLDHRQGRQRPLQEHERRPGRGHQAGAEVPHRPEQLAAAVTSPRSHAERGNAGRDALRRGKSGAPTETSDPGRRASGRACPRGAWAREHAHTSNFSIASHRPVVHTEHMPGMTVSPPNSHSGPDATRLSLNSQPACLDVSRL